MHAFVWLALAFMGLGSCESSLKDQLISDPGVAGPPLEVVHLYHGQWPTGITVSKDGRKFSCYPSGLDANNTNDGANGRYQVAELLANGTEVPYPNVEINSPPGGAINYSTYPATGASLPTHLLGVQSVVIDPLQRLWLLDTGRGLTPNNTLVPASLGGPKLVAVNITTNVVIKTIVFPQSVAGKESYLNDVRFDLRRSLDGTSGQGVAYITDSSPTGGIVVVDLGTGESWRKLDGYMQVHAENGYVPWVWGAPVYYEGPDNKPISIPLGSDGIALSENGGTLFFGPVGGRRLYSVPTASLRLNRTDGDAMIKDLGERGVSDGFEMDSMGRVYMGNSEQNAVVFYEPRNGSMGVLVRNSRINWVDTLSVADDGYLYFTTNQLHLTPTLYPGTDRRKRPFALFRAKLPGNATKVNLVD